MIIVKSFENFYLLSTCSAIGGTYRMKRSKAGCFWYLSVFSFDGVDRVSIWLSYFYFSNQP